MSDPKIEESTTASTEAIEIEPVAAPESEAEDISPEIKK